ncbi:GNAT family N-acetyltransferase [Saccharopolyspora flava]|uniref:Protein N-acetyltransferase, RimJ/RimL family n=1 Tax=Saccharopolyspora flava TaxID=95161 RepID=A0A1I6QK69_9PSEU|nr:GNAT family N-acetyltransferase [Saccharopolyspora flava]SFS52861.1 Protein N-acetyltransferase, RimJ/RimL family [Saccharopolyspora flava]
MEVPVEIPAGPYRLRRWRSGDVGQVFRACQDPEIQRWTTVPVPYTEADAEGFVAGVGDQPVFAVTERGDDVLGSFGLVVEGEHGEVGCWVAPWARRIGVGEAAGRGLARWALGEAGLRRLEWIADVGNGASLRLAARIGFVPERTLPDYLENRDGTRSDAVLAVLHESP